MTEPRSEPPDPAPDPLPEWAEPYRALLRCLPDLAWLKDRDSRYVAANEAFVRQLRDDLRVRAGRRPLSCEELVGRSDRELFPAPLAEEHRSHERRVLRDGRERRVRVETPLRGGSSRRLEVTLAPLRDPAGAVVGTLGTAREVDEPGERPAIPPSRLSGVAHELSGPLSTILNFAQMLLMEPRSEDDREALSTVQREAERAAEILSDLRGVARRAPRQGESLLAPAGSRPLRVLVVDDEATIRFSVKRFLERRGHRVDAASDGGEALALLGEDDPDPAYDVILSDLRMPGLDGEELLERLRSRGDGLDDRVVFMTGDDGGEGATGGPGATRGRALLKPVCLQEIARVVEGFGDGARPA